MNRKLTCVKIHRDCVSIVTLNFAIKPRKFISRMVLGKAKQFLHKYLMLAHR